MTPGWKVAGTVDDSIGRGQEYRVNHSKISTCTRQFPNIFFKMKLHRYVRNVEKRFTTLLYPGGASQEKRV